MASISFNGSGFDWDINLYGFTPGELVEITFDKQGDQSGDLFVIDTYVGYNPIHTVHQSFTTDMEGNWNVGAYGTTGGEKATNYLTIGNPANTAPITNTGGNTPTFGQIEDISGAQAPEVIPQQSMDYTPIIIGAGVLLGGMMLLSAGGKSKKLIPA